MSGVVWVESVPPPAHGHGSPSAYHPLLIELKKNPGQWAELDFGKDKNKANSVSMWFRKYGCEAQRRTFDGVFRLYVRWSEPQS